MAAAAVLMGEVIRPQHRGKAVGALQTGFPIGWGIAAVLATLFFSLMPAALAWRTLFWVGLSPALLVLFVRRLVTEPPVVRADAEKPGGGRQDGELPGNLFRADAANNRPDRPLVEPAYRVAITR